MSKKAPSQIYPVIIAVILIALIPFAFVNAPDSLIDRKPAESRVKLRTDNTHSPSASPRSNHRRSPVSSSHSADRLKNFHLSKLTFRDVSLEEALSTLIEDYQGMCQKTGEDPIPFKWSIEGDPDQIAFVRTNHDFISSCNFLALMAGMKCHVNGNIITFSAMQDGSIKSRTYNVPSNFQYRVLSLLADHEANPFYDPFEPEPLEDVFSWLKITGQNERVSYIPNSRTFEVKAGDKAMSKIDGIVESIFTYRPSNLSFHFTDHSEGENPPLTYASFQEQKQLTTKQLEAGRNEKYDQDFYLSVTRTGFWEQVDLYYGGMPSPVDRAIQFHRESDQTYLISPSDSHLEIEIPDSTGKLQLRTLHFSRHKVSNNFLVEDLLKNDQPEEE